MFGLVRGSSRAYVKPSVTLLVNISIQINFKNKINDLNLMISCPMHTDLYPLLKNTTHFFELHLQVKGDETGWL